MSARQVLSSDAQHNLNCYAYFFRLKKFFQQPELIKLLKTYHFNPYLVNPYLDVYHKDQPYGDFYSQLMNSLEKVISAHDMGLLVLTDSDLKALNQLVEAVYHNDNHILEEGSSGWINDIAAETRPQKANIGKKIAHTLKDPAQTVNAITPHDTEFPLWRFYSVFAPTLKPQTLTNIPTIKNHAYKTKEDPIEYRFSTQAQRDNGHSRVSPLFKRWLKINAEKYTQNPSKCEVLNDSISLKKSNSQIYCDSLKGQNSLFEEFWVHLYVNNMRSDPKEFDLPGSYERDLTRVLHELENDPELKIMVITLPAYAGLMNPFDYHLTKEFCDSSRVFHELLNVAQNKKHHRGISDFIISPQTRKFLFANREQEILGTLLKRSFLTQGVDPEKGTLSRAQKQAVWVHFIKYELTRYIIKTVKPWGYNFACKDAIDRGAVSSTYYNLMSSFASVRPMQQDEFERSIDAPAANTKGRGMNFHRKILWNTLNTYVTANYSELFTHSKKSWLIYWRDMNCPHSQVNDLLSLRLEQGLKFGQFLATENSVKHLGNQVLTTIQTLYKENTHGKRLLLEATSRTLQLMTAPSEGTVHHYKNLAEELKIKHPRFMILAGIMEMLLGALLYLPSFGYSFSLISQGHAAIKTGFFAPQRTALSEEMQHFAKQFQNLSEENDPGEQIISHLTPAATD